MKNDAATHLRISLLGAPGTGKTRLAADLLAALPARDQPAPSFTIHDNPTQPLALAEPHACGLVLLMGLDLPAPDHGLERETADRALRTALAQAGMAYQVVYGHGAERLQSALRALQAWLPAHGTHATTDRTANRAATWVWACDNCSDPQCERRLLSDLLAARASPRTLP